MRKTQIVAIGPEGGRDAGKSFLLTEMAARPAEKWATRAFLALSRAGIDIPEDIAQQGIAGLAIVGFKMLGGMSFQDAEPLLDEMMACVQFLPNPATLQPRPLVDNGTEGDDIEEVQTRIRLRAEVFTLHTGFTFADAGSKLTSMAPA